MFILIIVQLLTAGLFLLFGYLILKKQAYALVSGFNMKTEEEQKQLVANGYPQASARGIIRSGWILLAGIIVHLSGVPFAIEVSWLAMFVYLLSYLFYINKLSLERERKKNAAILTVLTLFTGGLLIVIFYAGLSDNELQITDTEVVIDGFYGVEWGIDDLTDLRLMEELPDVQVRINGFSFIERSKGQFRLDKLGTGRLFVYRDQPPFLYIEKGSDYAIINWQDADETKLKYEILTNNVKSTH